MSQAYDPSRRVLPHAWKSLAVHGGVVLALVALTQNQSQSIQASQQKEYEEIQNKLDDAESQAKTAEADLLRQILADEIMEPFADLIDDSDLDLGDANAILADLREDVAADVDTFLATTLPSDRTSLAMESFKQAARIEALATLQHAVNDQSRSAILEEVTDFTKNELSHRLADTMSEELKRQASNDLMKRFEQEQTKALSDRLSQAREDVAGALKNLDKIKKDQDKIRKNMGKDPAKQEAALKALAGQYQENMQTAQAAADTAVKTGAVDSSIGAANAKAAEQTAKAYQDTLNALAKNDKATTVDQAEKTSKSIGDHIDALKKAQGQLDQAVKKRQLNTEDQAYAKALVESLDITLSKAAELALQDKAGAGLTEKISESAADRLEQLGLDRKAAKDEVSAAVSEALKAGLAEAGKGVSDQALLGIRDKAGALDHDAIATAEKETSAAASALKDLAAQQRNQQDVAKGASADAVQKQAGDQKALSEKIASTQKAAQAATELAQRATPAVGKSADDTGKQIAKENPAAKASQAAASMDLGASEQAQQEMASAADSLEKAAADMDSLAKQLGEAKAQAESGAAQASAVSAAAQASAAESASALASAAQSKVDSAAAKAAEKTSVGSGMSNAGSMRTAKLGNLADRVDAMAEKAEQGRDNSETAASATGDLATTNPVNSSPESSPESSAGLDVQAGAESVVNAADSSDTASTQSPAQTDAQASTQASTEAASSAMTGSDAATASATTTGDAAATPGSDSEAAASQKAAAAQSGDATSAAASSTASTDSAPSAATPGTAGAGASAAPASASAGSAGASSGPGAAPSAAPSAAVSNGSGSSTGMGDGMRWDTAAAAASAGGEGGGVAVGHGFNAYATYNHDLYERMRATQASRGEQAPGNAYGNEGAGATTLQASMHDEISARQSKSAVVFVPDLTKSTQVNSTDGQSREAPAPNFATLAHAAAEYQGTSLNIDGDISDWGELKHPITMQFLKEGGTPSTPDTMYMRWSPGGLYFCWFVPNRSEDQVKKEPVDAKPYEGDLLELYIDPENLRKGNMRSAPNTQQLLMIPFGWRDPKATIVEVGRGFRGIAVHSYRPYAQGDMGMVAAQFRDGGYWVEAALSVHALASPNLRAGMWLAANFSINKGYDYSVQQQWSAPKDTDTFNRPDTWGDILLLGSDAKAEFLADEVGQGEASGNLISPGDSVRVRVVDKDMNYSSTAQDRLLSEVRIHGSTASMYVVLEETTPDSGVFEGSFNTQLRYLPQRDNTISVAGGETLQLFYADKRAAFGERDRTCISEVRVALPVFSLE